LRLGGEALGGLAAWASSRRACRRRGRGPLVATWDGVAWRGASLSQRVALRDIAHYPVGEERGFCEVVGTWGTWAARRDQRLPAKLVVAGRGWFKKKKKNGVASDTTQWWPAENGVARPPHSFFFFFLISHPILFFFNYFIFLINYFIILFYIYF
jgi:hypothetical protein